MKLMPSCESAEISSQNYRDTFRRLYEWNSAVQGQISAACFPFPIPQSRFLAGCEAAPRPDALGAASGVVNVGRTRNQGELRPFGGRV